MVWLICLVEEGEQKLLRVEYYFRFLIFLLHFFCLKSNLCHSFSNNKIQCGSWSSSSIVFWDRFCKQLFFSMTSVWAWSQNICWPFSTMVFFGVQYILLLLSIVCMFGVLFWHTIGAFKLETANSRYKQNFQVRGDCLRNKMGVNVIKDTDILASLLFLMLKKIWYNYLKEYAFSL